MVLVFLQEDDDKEPTFWIEDFLNNVGDNSITAWFVVEGFKNGGIIQLNIVHFEHGSVIDKDLIAFDGEGNVLSN